MDKDQSDERTGLLTFLAVHRGERRNSASYNQMIDNFVAWVKRIGRESAAPQGGVELPPIPTHPNGHPWQDAAIVKMLQDYARAAVALNRRPVAEHCGHCEILHAEIEAMEKNACDHFDQIAAYDAALTSPATSEPVMPVAPNGWQLVPVEPTDEMLVSGQEAWVAMRPLRNAVEDCREAEAVYRAMICVAAVPVAPSGAREDAS